MSSSAKGDLHLETKTIPTALASYSVAERNLGFIESLVQSGDYLTDPIEFRDLFNKLTVIHHTDDHDDESFYYDYRNDRPSIWKNTESPWRITESNSRGLDGKVLFSHLQPDELDEAAEKINERFTNFQKSLNADNVSYEDLIKESLRIYAAIDLAHFPVDGAGRFAGEMIQLMYRMIQAKYPTVHNQYLPPILSGFRGNLIEERLFQLQISERGSFFDNQATYQDIQEIFEGKYDKNLIYRLNNNWKIKTDIINKSLVDSNFFESDWIESLKDIYNSVSGNISEQDWQLFMELLTMTPLYNHNYVYLFAHDDIPTVVENIISIDDGDSRSIIYAKNILAHTIRDRLARIPQQMRKGATLSLFGVESYSSLLHEIRSCIENIQASVDLYL